MNQPAQSQTLNARTLSFYDSNAVEYSKAANQLDLTTAYEHFLKHLLPKARLLDAGSGSGRDTRHFLQLGFDVDAFDASPALAALSTQYTGVRTRVMDFSAVDVTEQYDGIWACASLLHVPRSDLPSVLRPLSRALKVGGILYASFRHGTHEKVSRDGRFFADMNYELAVWILKSVRALRLVETWIDVGPGVHDNVREWFNMICRRQAT